MKCFKCDRCLAYYDRETDGVQINLKFSGAMIDLCPECAEKFYGWLGEPQATAKAMFAGKERAE